MHDVLRIRPRLKYEFARSVKDARENDLAIDGTRHLIAFFAHVRLPLSDFRQECSQAFEAL